MANPPDSIQSQRIIVQSKLQEKICAYGSALLVGEGGRRPDEEELLQFFRT
jgi:hypothetical protein